MSDARAMLEQLDMRSLRQILAAIYDRLPQVERTLNVQMRVAHFVGA